ncbi:hypothetical protein OEA41_004573 [Lepraria neglecta]|uniref:GST C-terminal domain-containing protein n=1 Tax=Lepraria neglecta TaxID=209136 RepID=A0AAD9Z1A3_9LECA|nr:hypothetical protein OEA41_004573 [Lepraria neglecta]
MAQNDSPKPDIFNLANRQGKFDRVDSKFRSWISTEAEAKFPPEENRYVLYISLVCPWAQRANIVRTLKGLEDIIQLVVLDYELFPEGWSFTGRLGTDAKDPIYGFTRLSQLYLKADPEYKGRYTVPTLWDTKHSTIVSNESAEIIRMLYSSFDQFLPADLREANKANGGLFPTHLRTEIEEMNDWIYHTINNGVYKAGFATKQEVYEENCLAVFASLDRVEELLADSEGNYLLGKELTEADVRLFPTIVRFDTAYHNLFKCNLKMVRHDYPHVNEWMKRLYYDKSEVTRGAFRSTTNFDQIKKGYALTPRNNLVPLGPAPDILPLDECPGDAAKEV